MYIEPETLYALNIFKSNESVLEKREKKRSLFDLISHTYSAQGYRLLRRWFHAPLANLSGIQERLNTVEALISQDNAQYFEMLAKVQKQMPNINHVLSTIQLGNPNVECWSQMVRFLNNSLYLCNIVLSMSNIDSAKILLDIVNQVDTEILKSINDSIDETVDFDLSKQWKRVYVRDGLIPSLDALRIDYECLEITLEEAAVKIALEYPNLSSDLLNVVYMPQVGYLISVDIEGQKDVPHDWREVFTTATNLYYKDQYTSTMDDVIGDVYQLIIDLEIEVTYLLQTRVLENSELLLKAGVLFAQLDCYMSLASLSSLNGYIKPEMVESNVIEVKNGRHPLFEHLAPCFIANSSKIEDCQISIITGANGSGKSLYLSQIGMIVYLSHIGCFVPAEYAKIGITDKILSKIATLESLEKCESSFSIDLQKMSKCLKLATRRSLLLIDEFGKGTDVIGGPALLGAIIEELSSLDEAPKTIITTHFHELLKNEILQRSEKVVHNHMEVVFQDSVNGKKELTYLYQLKEGLTANSFGIE